MGNFLVFFEDVAFFVVVFSWYFLGGLSGGGGVGFERDHRVREGEQVGSACQPNFVHYCALAASPLLSCNVYAPVFRKEKLCLLHMYIYRGFPKKSAAGAMVHLLICQQPAPSATGLGREYP